MDNLAQFFIHTDIKCKLEVVIEFKDKKPIQKTRKCTLLTGGKDSDTKVSKRALSLSSKEMRLRDINFEEVTIL